MDQNSKMLMLLSLCCACIVSVLLSGGLGYYYTNQTATNQATTIQATASTVPAAAGTAAPVSKDRLANGRWLYQDGSISAAAFLQSAGSLYVAGLQTDGNLCVHRTDNNKLCWCSSAGGSSVPLKLIMQNDNNLVVYANATNDGSTGSAAGKAIWASKTNGSGTAGTGVLVMQDDGNFVIYANTGPIWASNAGC